MHGHSVMPPAVIVRRDQLRTCILKSLCLCWMWDSYSGICEEQCLLGRNVMWSARSSLLLAGDLFGFLFDTEKYVPLRRHWTSTGLRGVLVNWSETSCKIRVFSVIHLLCFVFSLYPIKQNQSVAEKEMLTTDQVRCYKLTEGSNFGN
jgi:hypothetical protein